MSLAKTIARQIILPLSLNLKVDKYFLKKTSKSCCIINFHGVRKNNNTVFNNRHLPVSEFEKIIIYLKKNYDIVPLSELFEIHRTKRKVTRKTVALTFDDGYLNNFEIALPVLKKYNAPATFYIISKGLLVDNYLSWPDAIDLVMKNHKENIHLDGHTFKHPAFYNEELKLDLPAYLKTCGDRTEKLAYELANKFNYQVEEIKKKPELLLMINGEGISKYANEPLLEFGAHSHSHCNMEFLNKEVAEFELKTSKDLVEQKTGKKVISFAFPDGSYSAETMSIAKKVGYENMAAVSYKNKENNSDPNLLSRFTISNSTTFESNVLRLSREFETYGFN